MRCHRVCCNTCNGKCKSVQFVGRRFDLSQRYVVPLPERIRDNMNYRATGNIGTLPSFINLFEEMHSVVSSVFVSCWSYNSCSQHRNIFDANLFLLHVAFINEANVSFLPSWSNFKRIRRVKYALIPKVVLPHPSISYTWHTPFLSRYYSKLKQC